MNPFLFCQVLFASVVWQFSFPEYIFRCVFAIDYASPLWVNWSEQQKTDVVIYGSCAQMTCHMSNNRSYTINPNKILNDQKSLPWSKAFPKDSISLQSLRQLTMSLLTWWNHPGMRNWLGVWGKKAMYYIRTCCFSRLLHPN